MSLDQLLKELKNPSLGYPRCLIINEIGEVCLDGNAEERKKAEQALLTMLRDREEESREIVFACLSIIEHPDPETAVALQEFKIDPVNKAMVEEMQPKIARFKLLNGVDS